MPLPLGRRVLLLLALLGAGAGAHAGAALQSETDGGPAAATVPFSPGEKADFQVKLGGVPVGKGSMEVVGVERVHDNLTYHTRLRLAGGIPLFRVDDKLESWIDVDQLFSRRFKQDQKEIRFRRNRTYDFFPESRTYRRLDNGETGSIPTADPLDDVSFVYYARTLPLKVGDVYRIERYFKAEGNPVVIKVLRKETVTVPAGTFRTVVVQPIIQTEGLFGKGGEALIYFSDDERHVMVQLRSSVPLVGSLSMHLQTYRPGEPFGGARP